METLLQHLVELAKGMTAGAGLIPAAGRTGRMQSLRAHWQLRLLLQSSHYSHTTFQ